MLRRELLAGALFLSCTAVVNSSYGKESATQLPVVFSDDFEHGLDHWELLDSASWKIAEENGNHVLSQHVKAASYKPPHRSPFHVALVKDVEVGDFDFTARVKSTHPDYGHRDVVVVFGYQNPGQFYYVHFGRQTDPHANQIFVVDEAPREKISITTTDGTPWTDDWHTVRVRRSVDDGTIEVYFDDMENPAMTAIDKRFKWGRVGVGTFDDTADWDDVELRGVEIYEAKSRRTIPAKPERPLATPKEE